MPHFKSVLKGSLFAALIAATTALVAAEAAIIPEGSAVPELPPELVADYVDPTTVDKTAPFATGEKLQFRLGWSLFKVAKATLQVEPDSYNEATSLKISLSARTNSFADTFYKVRNLSTSWVAEDMSRSFEYSAVQREAQALFDTVSLKARYKNNSSGEEIGPVDILPGTFDPLGIVLFVRCLDFEVGDRLIVPTSNGKEFFYTYIKVVKKVKRRFSLGTYEAYVLEPDIKDIGGVFKRSKNGMIRIFFSADEQKLPLRMESEVAVGKFWAELVDVEAPEDPGSVAVAKVD
jgi:hypothetical protein